jgi:glutaredoxin
MEIVQVSGMRTVPQIFNGEVTSENLLWGYSDVKSLHDQWKLLELLK